MAKPITVNDFKAPDLGGEMNMTASNMKAYASTKDGASAIKMMQKQIDVLKAQGFDTNGVTPQTLLEKAQNAQIAGTFPNGNVVSNVQMIKENPAKPGDPSLVAHFGGKADPAGKPAAPSPAPAAPSVAQPVPVSIGAGVNAIQGRHAALGTI